MAKLDQLAHPEQRIPSTAAESPLTPAFKDFVDRAIVPALMRQALAELEQRLAVIRERLKVSDRQTVKLHMRETRPFIDSRLRDLGAIWDGKPQIAREEIAKHVGKITLKPELRTYVATGIWNWLGVPGRVAALVVPGARIELATPAFSGRRSTTELPRHVWFRNCMGSGAIVSIHLKWMRTFAE